MTSLDDDFFEQWAFESKLEKLMALSKISRCHSDYDGPSIHIPSPVREMERETKVTKDPVLSSDDESAKYVQPTVVQEPKLTIAPKPSRIDPNLSRFTVKSLSSKHAELRAVPEKNDLPANMLSLGQFLKRTTYPIFTFIKNKNPRP
jgi:hypothetical protein